MRGGRARLGREMTQSAAARDDAETTCSLWPWAPGQKRRRLEPDVGGGADLEMGIKTALGTGAYGTCVMSST